MKRLESSTEIFGLLRSIRKEMLRLAQQHDPIGKDDLSGWCIITSYVLFHILKRRGYHPYVAKNWGHAFIVMDGWYIDVTCTQFNGYLRKKDIIEYPPVYIRKSPAPGAVHDITDKTDKAEAIWRYLCPGWHQPVTLDNPVVRNLVENY